MEKNAEYYEARLRKKADTIYKEDIFSLPDNEFLEKIDQFNDELSYQAMLTRIAYNFPEAKEIINKLIDNLGNSEPEEVHDLTWVSVSSKKMPFGGELVTTKMTRKEMLERLQRISSENFGEDLEEWKSWLAAFEETPPPKGFR